MIRREASSQLNSRELPHQEIHAVDPVSAYLARVRELNPGQPESRFVELERQLREGSQQFVSREEELNVQLEEKLEPLKKRSGSKLYNLARSMLLSAIVLAPNVYTLNKNKRLLQLLALEIPGVSQIYDDVYLGKDEKELGRYPKNWTHFL